MRDRASGMFFTLPARRSETVRWQARVVRNGGPRKAHWAMSGEKTIPWRANRMTQLSTWQLGQEEHGHTFYRYAEPFAHPIG